MTDNNFTERLASDAEGIARAAALLRAGELVALPTETVYGLAARADDEAAVRAIYSAKGRPDFNPLIVHVSNLTLAEELADFSEKARKLAAKFWPGSLTIVLPRKPVAAIAPAVSADLPTIALRVPAHPVMQAVLAKLRLPLAAPSANVSGAISPTQANHVLASLEGRIAAVLDGGPCTAGLESTIVALRQDGSWEVLRPGPITESAITNVLGQPNLPKTNPQNLSHLGVQGIEAPGQLLRHYSPGKPVRLDADSAEADEYMIGFGATDGDCNLSSSANLEEAAARLYDCLHRAASSAKPRIAIAPVPNKGIGVAINNRLVRARA